MDRDLCRARDAYHRTGSRELRSRLRRLARELPAKVRRIDAPTPLVWVIGRTQCNGPADFEAVNRFQDRLTITPLSGWGKTVPPVTGTKDPSVDDRPPPLRQVEAMTAADFFTYATELMKTHRPYFNDYPLLARMERIGLVPGQNFDLRATEPVVNAALDEAVPDARTRIRERQKTVGQQRNGWVMNTETMGAWGTGYLKRATIALVGLGADLPEDAIYPMTSIDAPGPPLTGVSRYRLHFDKLPPVLAFWSVTLYDNEGFPVANPLNRFALGDRDPLTYNPDGSLDLHIQTDSPGTDKESNWLPAPSGPFNLTMRLYYTRHPPSTGHGHLPRCSGCETRAGFFDRPIGFTRVVPPCSRSSKANSSGRLELSSMPLLDHGYWARTCQG